MRVLVIDDDEATLRTLEALCHSEGHTTTTAYSGADGLASSEATQPDIILLDWMLADADGADIARAIRQGPQPQALILMLTSLDASTAAQHVADIGIDALVSKPLRPPEVRAALRTMIQRSDRAVQLPRAG